MLFVKKDIKKLLSVMIPILVAQVSTAGVTFINTTMAGHAGADDLAGVSVGAGLFYPLLASIIGLLMAGTPLMAQLIGRKERESLPFIVRSGMVIGLSVWALFTAAYFFFIDDLLASLALEAAVEHIARYYLMTMIGVVFFLALMIPLRCLTDTAGSTSISMKMERPLGTPTTRYSRRSFERRARLAKICLPPRSFDFITTRRKSPRRKP